MCRLILASWIFSLALLSAQSAVAEFSIQSTETNDSLLNRRFLNVEDAFQLHLSSTPDSLILRWEIAPQYYLYRDNFKFIALDDATQLGEPSLPPGSLKWDDYFARDLEVYYNQSNITLPAQSKTGAIAIEIESQGCADAGLCYPPRKQQFNIDLVSGLVTVRQATPERDLSTTEEALPFAVTLLFALLGGMLLNLMPCVFPVLSIKAMSFVAAHGSATANRLHGLVYSAGVILSFVAIAALMLTLRAGGEAVGWGFQLQSPLFISALIYLFFAMALALAGVFEFGAGLMAIGQASAEGTSYRASFMTGVLATTVASPCTAPFMGPALGFTLTQPPAVALLVFACLGLGMALPFVVLTWLPSLRDRLPRPGPWMEYFKQALAFPLLLTAVWLLWVLGRQTDTDTVAAICVGLIFFSLAGWLWRMPSRTAFGGVKLIAIAALGAALMTPWLALNNAGNAPRWESYSDTRLSALRAADSAVFVNLSADWCVTCLVNERVALSSDAFYATLDAREITYLKGDWTNGDAEITALLNRFQRTGVPLYLFYPAGSNQARVLDQILTLGTVLSTLNEKIND